MAKQLLKISDFTGGLNSYFDGKDIANNEFQALDNAEVDENGIIRVSGGISRDIVLDNSSVDNFRLISNANPGTGLYSFFSDYSSMISSWASDIYSYPLDTTNFDSSWTFVDGDGTGWKVSDNVSPVSQVVGVPRSYINAELGIADRDGASDNPSSLGSITTPEILLKANTEYTLKFKAMCAGSDSWFYSGLSIPPHLKIHDMSLDSPLYYYSNDGTGYVETDVTATNFLTNDQANMFSSSIGGWTAIGSTAPAQVVAKNRPPDDGSSEVNPEIEEYCGGSNDVKALVVESDGDYTEPSHEQSASSGSFGAKSADISGTDTTHGFLADASYYLDVMCVSDNDDPGDPIIEVRWKDISDSSNYKVIYSKRFPQRTEWSHINISKYDGVGSIDSPGPNTSFKSIKFKLPSAFDTANDRLQIRVGCHGDGKKAYFTGFNLRRAMNELGNDIKVFGHNSEILSYPVSYNMTNASLLFADGSPFEGLVKSPREYQYKFVTNNFVYETYKGEDYVKVKFEFVAGKWGKRSAYANLEFYISDLSIIGIGGRHHTLAFSEYFSSPNETNLALSYYSKNGYSQTDKSLFPLKYSGKADVDFNYVNGRLLMSDGNLQNNNKSYQYYYNNYANKFILSKTAPVPPRIFNLEVGTYAPYAANEKFDVLQEYLGASSSNNSNINAYASDSCQNNSWGVIGGHETGQASVVNKVDMNASGKFSLTTSVDTDGGGGGTNGGGGGARKRIIINQDAITGKTDDIANIYIKITVYALVGPARDTLTYSNVTYNAAYPWYQNEKVAINMDIKKWADSTYAIDADTDPHALGSIPELVFNEDLSTPYMGISTNGVIGSNNQHTDGWYTELDINTVFEDGTSGLAGPIGEEAQDGYPRKYISCIVERSLNVPDGLFNEDENVLIDISLDVNAINHLDHHSQGDVTYDSFNPNEPVQSPPGLEPYTLASGFSAIHIDMIACDIEFHSGTTTNASDISKDDIGLSFTFETPSAEHTAEGWGGLWTAAITSVNIHGEESFLRKAEFNEILCDTSTKSPIISLVHSGSLDTSEIKYFKVYTSYSDSEIYYLQMTCDIQNKKAWSSTGGTRIHANFFSDAHHATWIYQTPSKENLNPNEVNSYESETQVSQEDAENEQTMTAQYKCSVVANNHLYVGNIKQNGVIKSDVMLKSPEGKPGILPATNDITVVTNDGDEIIDLHYFKNKLLQFKKNRIYVIGTDEGDYLDEVLENVGIEHKSQVVSTSVGIFWINENGSFGWDGEKLTNFSEGKVARKKWKNTISNWLLYNTLRPSIGYLRKENKLIIWPSSFNTTLTKYTYPVDYSDGISDGERDNLEKISTNEYGYIYDLDGNRWSMIYKGVDGEILTSSLQTPSKDETSRMYGIEEDSYNAPVTNFSYDINDNLIWGIANPSGFNIYKWDDFPSTTSGIADNERDFRIITKDFDFDSPSVKKKIYKVYVTFKSTFEEAIHADRRKLSKGVYSPPNVKVYYSINSSDTWTEFSATKSKNYDSTGLTTSIPNYTTVATLSRDLPEVTTGISVADISSYFSDTTYLKEGRVLKINDEQLLISSISSTFYNFTRGYNNTSQTMHPSTSNVLISESDWIEAELKPTTSINNINSIAFKFATNTDDDKAVPRGFAINDISVLYRLKRIK